MKKRKGIKRFFVEGQQQLKCADCDEETVFNHGTLLGELPNLFSLSEDMIHRLYSDCFSGARLGDICSKCEYVEDHIIFWLEFRLGDLMGPFCQNCFYHYVTGEYGGVADAQEDANVFYIRVNDTNQQIIAESASYFANKLEDESSEEDSILDQVNPLDLF